MEGFGISGCRQRSGLCFHAPVLLSPATRRSYGRGDGGRAGKTRSGPAMQGGGGGGGLFHVAPMQCYTNRHLRFLLRQLSSKAVLWTEMEKVESFMGSEEATRRTLRFDPGERPLVLQLGGDDAKLLAAASRRGSMLGFDEINLNCGCPSIESGGKANFGAALMVDPYRTRALLAAMADASKVPVSVKCRLGVHDRIDPGAPPPEDSYEALAAFVSAVASSGAISRFVVPYPHPQSPYTSILGDI